MRRFYPPLKKGHSRRHFAKPSIAHTASQRLGDQLRRVRIAPGHGRIYRHPKDLLAPSSNDLLSRKPRFVNKLRIRAAVWSTRI